MMPGVKVNIECAPTAIFDPAAPGKWFCAQLLEKGPTNKPILVTSMSEMEELTGGRVSYSYMYDAAQTFFEEGGSELFLARVVGKTPIAASLVLKHTAEASLKVEAKSVGEWGNELAVEVVIVSGEEYKLKFFLNKVLLEETPTLKTQVAAVTWSEGSKNITITKEAGTTNPTVLAEKALSGGTYDSAEVETKDWSEALALFDEELGCGQVSAPGITAEATLKLVEAHAEANNRTAIIDLPNTGVKGTLVSEVAPLAKATGARRTAPYVPWATIPGIAAGAARTVPYSAVQAGILARNDASSTPPPVGEPSAGTNGHPRYANGLTHEWTRQEREELNNANINVARTMPTGSIETYGNRTLAAETEPAWQEVSSARLFMFIDSEGEALLEAAVFKNIDPKNILLSTVEGELIGFLKSLGGQLYSYSVSTGPDVNTEATKKAKEVRANVEVKPSQIAENVVLNLSVAA
jgi:phage tail sheath protein FI